jgi:energy-coupling factor transporter transmembrane protein EcfT
MEARGFGHPGHTRAPAAPRTTWDRLALISGIVLVVAGALWL